MAEALLKSGKVHSFLLVVVAVVYVGWAGGFVARSSVETDNGRYFCLFDDAMVSLRYAWNLAHGAGLVWNPGERVEGITSFLFTIYMALGALFLSKSGAVLFVQLSGILLVLGVSLLARRLSCVLGATPRLGLITTGAVLAYYPLSYWSLMGMETGLLTALAMLALLVALRLGSEAQGSKALGLLLGSMFATRPDAALPALVMLTFRAAWILLRQRRLRALAPWLTEAASFAGVVAALTLFRFLYYGSLLPNTYQLKMGDWPLHPRLENGWKFVQPFLDTSRYLFLLALCSGILQRDGRRLMLLCFAGSVIAGQIWVGGDAWRYWRLLVPAVVVLIVLAVDGSHAVFRRLLRREWPRLGASVSLACVAGALWVANAPFMDELLMKLPAYTVNLNKRSVKDGLRLMQYVDPRGSVAVRAAGALPYYSGLRGVDVLGKSDAYVARLPPRGIGGTVTPGHNKYDLQYSLGKLRPDVIYDALAWARYERGNFEFVSRDYVQRESFRLRRDSPYVHWDRLPP